MQHASFLETTAEIAIAFAGFIGIFLVLARREGGFDQVVALSIRVIVLSSLSCVFYAALPLLLSAAGMDAPLLWRCASLALLAAGVSWTVHIVRLRTIGGELFGGGTLRSAQVLNLLALLAATSNVIGWPVGPSAAVYLVSIWLVLAVTAVNFASLIFDRVL